MAKPLPAGKESDITYFHARFANAREIRERITEYSQKRGLKVGFVVAQILTDGIEKLEKKK